MVMPPHTNFGPFTVGRKGGPHTSFMDMCAKADPEWVWVSGVGTGTNHGKRRGHMTAFPSLYLRHRIYNRAPRSFDSPAHSLPLYLIGPLGSLSTIYWRLSTNLVPLFFLGLSLSGLFLFLPGLVNTQIRMYLLN